MTKRIVTSPTDGRHRVIDESGEAVMVFEPHELALAEAAIAPRKRARRAPPASRPEPAGLFDLPQTSRTSVAATPPSKTRFDHAAAARALATDFPRTHAPLALYDRRDNASWSRQFTGSALDSAARAAPGFEELSSLTGPALTSFALDTAAYALRYLDGTGRLSTQMSAELHSLPPREFVEMLAEVASTSPSLSVSGLADTWTRLLHRRAETKPAVTLADLLKAPRLKLVDRDGRRAIAIRVGGDALYLAPHNASREAVEASIRRFAEEATKWPYRYPFRMAEAVEEPPYVPRTARAPEPLPAYEPPPPPPPPVYVASQPEPEPPVYEPPPRDPKANVPYVHESSQGGFFVWNPVSRTFVGRPGGGPYESRAEAGHRLREVMEQVLAPALARRLGKPRDASQASFLGPAPVSMPEGGLFTRSNGRDAVFGGRLPVASGGRYPGPQAPGYEFGQVRYGSLPNPARRPPPLYLFRR